MPPRKNQRRRKKSPVHFWQWLSLALGALLLYFVLQHYLSPERKIAKTKTSKQNIAHKKDPTPETPKPASKEPLESWNFESAAPYLPDEAFQDNYQAIATDQKTNGLLAYAKKIPGKEPGPQGMTETRPGLQYLVWKDGKYAPQAIPFEELKPALGSSVKNFVGIPQVGKALLKSGDAELFPLRLFLENDAREVLAYLVVTPEGASWASLHHASGKVIPAVFLKGTTQNTTREVFFRKHDGKYSLIVENGVLEEWKAYAGYQWNVQAYTWNGKDFLYEEKYSQELTRAKQLSPSGGKTGESK